APIPDGGGDPAGGAGAHFLAHWRDVAHTGAAAPVFRLSPATRHTLGAPGRVSELADRVGALVDTDDHGHAGRKPSVDFLFIVQGDADPDALGYLDEIAAGIVRLDHRKFRASRGREPLDMPRQGVPRQRVDPDLDRLPDLHAGELRLLEVCDNPDVVRHDRHQLAPGGDVLADPNADLAEAPVARRADFSIGEADLCQFHRSFRAGDSG